ncbi:MAG: hypothetical protein K0S39_823 [Paenibacillus sp.]|jgi:hypothetical protein|nr:hypothetical protein [Paenibacillus sp.]
MNLTEGKQELGVIICKYCGDFIATQETEKVTTYYSVCGKSSCSGAVSKNEEEVNHEC